MFSFYFREASVGTWRVMHVLKGTHICCALGAGRQHCYWGPNLIFSLFWSSTFNHWLLGGSAFPKKLFESWKKMLLQYVYGVIHVKRGREQKKCCLCQTVQRRMDSRVVGENRNITVSSQDIPNSQFQFLQKLLYRDGWDYICSARETAVGGLESRGQAPQDRFGFLWISTTAFIKPPFLISTQQKVTKSRLCESFGRCAHICLRHQVQLKVRTPPRGER